MAACAACVLQPFYLLITVRVRLLELIAEALFEAGASPRQDYTLSILCRALTKDLKISSCRKKKGKRQVAQILGQLMRSLAELPLGNIHDRIEPRLPASSRVILHAQLTMLHKHWRQDLLANDRRFVEVMGTQDDPNRSRLEQYFNMLLQMTA